MALPNVPLPTSPSDCEQWALEQAAQCWCEPTTSHIEMNVPLAEVFARKLSAIRQEAQRKWTSELPKVPGWYWYKTPTGFIWVENLDRVNGVLMTIDTQDGHAYKLSGYEGQWFGPLEVPGEKEG